MHIKQITLSNFRSFRQQPEIQPFSSGTNTIVGRNGSGKSNLFDAVQFCLLGSNRFANPRQVRACNTLLHTYIHTSVCLLSARMHAQEESETASLISLTHSFLTQEERQAILHEGSGSAAVNAFVEIVFDNSDHRFTVEASDEVVIRRTVGLHKDEFFLQRRRTSKQEIQSLLEGAGFSKSNPYFIVQQGKVQDLCTMSDPERLKLLQQVAGTVVYDEKKAESVRKMQENTSSVAKITDMLWDMETRLEALQSEKDELAAYTAADRQRRALEYCLYNQEWRKARTALEQVEHQRATHVQQVVTQLHHAAKDTHSRIRQAEARYQATAVARKRLGVAARQDDFKQALLRYTQLAVRAREAESLYRQSQAQFDQNQRELETLVTEIAATQEELRTVVQPQYDQAAAVLQDMVERRDDAARQRQALYAKQGRGRQFATQQERDAFLQGAIQELEAAQAEKQTELDGQRDSLANLRRTVEQETKDVARLQQQLTQQSANLQAIAKSREAKKSERLALHDARKEEWRKSQELSEQLREAREDYQRARSGTRKTMPRATAMGLDALNNIVEQEGLVRGQQYFGMLMDNMTLRDEKYQTAVEVAAQNSLFHVIVDTDQTASTLMTRLEKGKLGRVTFLPLNRLRMDKVHYPDSNDVRPMLDLCISYDRKVERAMQHVFGKKLLARSPELASEWSAKLSMDALTLDGDLCTRKGALTGGYVDSSQSRLQAHARQTAARAALNDAERDYQTGHTRAQEADQATTRLMQELQRLEAKHAELLHRVTAQETEMERLQSRREQHQKQVSQVEATGIPPLEKSIAELEGDMERLRQEMGTALVKTLSEEDRQVLQQLKKVQAELVTEIEKQSEVVAQAGLERQKLQSLLDDNLLKRQRELSKEGGDNDDEERLPGRKLSTSAAVAQEQRKEELEDLQHQLQVQTRVKEEMEARLEEARREEEKLRSELIAGKNELEQLKSQDLKNMKALEEAQDKSDRLLNKVRVIVRVLFLLV